MSEDTPVHIKFATLTGPTLNAEDPMKSTARLMLSTEDKYEITFDLDIMAIAILGLTVGPICKSLKAMTDGAKQ